MTRILQGGELPTRLRRSCGLLGQDHYLLEENAIPVVILEDASILPFSRQPYRVGKYTTKTANVTNNPTVALRNEVALGGAGVLLLDSLIVSCSSSAKIEIDKYGLLDPGPVSQGNLLDLSTPISPAGTAVAPNAVPCRVYNYNDVAVALGFPGSSLGVLRVSSTAGLVIPLGFPIYPQEVVYVVCQVATATMELCWAGRWFPDVTA